MLATLGLATGSGVRAPLKRAEVTETQRTPRGWGHRAEARAEQRTPPRSPVPGARRLLPDPLVHPRQQLRAPHSLAPVPTRRGDVQRTLGLGGPRVSRFPALLRWIPRRRRLLVPARGGARAQEQGAAGAVVTSTSTGGEGAGRGQGRRRRAGGGERATRGAGERGRRGRLGPELCLPEGA